MSPCLSAARSDHASADASGKNTPSRMSEITSLEIGLRVIITSCLTKSTGGLMILWGQLRWVDFSSLHAALQNGFDKAAFSNFLPHFTMH